MFTSVTDYAAVYDAAYRASRGDHTSFDAGVLPSRLLAFCKDVSCTALLDVSGGQGRLRALAVEGGLKALATDLVAAPDRGVLALDLATFEETALTPIRRQMVEVFAERLHVTSCFDVLEHIDREHVPSALRYLRELTDRYLVVSISTRPSARNNRFHSTILPMGTWLRLFAMTGFRRVPKAIEGFAAATRGFGGTVSGEPLVDHWRQVDPFADVADGEPQYIVLEKQPNCGDWAGIADEMKFLLDVRYREKKRQFFAAAVGERFVFNLHHAQEFPFFRALLDVIPRGHLTVLFRRGFMPLLQHRAMLGLFARNGITTHVYDRARELPWEAIAGQRLITAAESGVASSHALSQQIVSLAKLHGCPTLLLQHGIWPAAFEGRIAAFASDDFVTWGSGDAQVLTGNTHRIMGAKAPWGVLRPGQERRIGSPRFADQLMPCHPDGLEAWLGVARGRHDRVVMLATKDLSGRLGRPNVDASLVKVLGDMADSHPETMFLLRPHPANTALDLLALRRVNLRFLDESCCIAADLQMSRIMPLVDVVLTTPSSLVLDAAVSGKPTIVYGPGQRPPYEDFEPVPTAGISALLHDEGALQQAATRAASFRFKNDLAPQEQFYERLAILLTAPHQTSPTDFALASCVSLSTEVELQLLTCRQTEAALQASGQALQTSATALREANTLNSIACASLRRDAEEAIAAARQELDEARAQANAACNALTAIVSSASWRATALLRRAIDTTRRLIRKGAGA